MTAAFDDLPWQERRSVERCSDCRVYDASVVLCGWHENTVAAAFALQCMTAKERKQ